MTHSIEINQKSLDGYSDEANIYKAMFVMEEGAVKFVVLPDADSQKAFSGDLGRKMRQQENFVFAKVDARYITKAHMVDRLFHKVAKQLDWDELAYQYVDATSC